jgi:hypothetical protein
MRPAKGLNPWTFNNGDDNDNNGYVEQSHCSAGQEIPSLLRKSKVHYRDHGSQPGDTWFQSTSPHPGSLKYALILNSAIFWDVMLCDLVWIHRHFGETYCLHLHGGKLSQASIQKVCCSLGLLWDLEDGDSNFSRNVGKLLPDYLAPQPRRLLFVATDMGTSNLVLILSFNRPQVSPLPSDFCKQSFVYWCDDINTQMNKAHLFHNGRLFQQVQYSLAVMTAVCAVKALLVI